MADSDNLAMPLLSAAQAQKHVTHNEALRVLDAVVQLSVKDRSLTTPPGSPTSGDRYIPTGTATGDWTGHEGKIVAYQDGAWEVYTPLEGWICWVDDEDKALVYSGSSWLNLFSSAHNGTAAFPAYSFVSDQDTGMYRIGANRLGFSAGGVNTFEVSATQTIVTSAAPLFTRAVDNIHITVNKEASGDDASFTYQTNYSTRALVGLLASDDYTIKVSPDGSTFYTGIVIDKDNGYVTMEQLFGSKVTFPTVSSGVLTVTSSYAVPAPESGTSDTIDTISGGQDGSILILSGTAGDTLTFSESGNMKLGASRVLDNFDDTLMLVKRGSDWLELSFSNNG